MIIRLWFAILVAVTFATGAVAQSPELRPFPVPEAGLWATGTWQGPLAYAASAEEACRIQQAEFNPNATPLPTTYRDEDDMSCNWIPRQHGGPDNRNTILPTLVRLVCAPDHRIINSHCELALPPQPICNGECGGSPVSGTAQPNLGHPMNVNSGFKVLSETDYATADGLFSVDRQYLSRDGWRTLLPGYLVMHGYWNEQVSYHTRHGGRDDFVAANRNDQNNWGWVLPNFYGAPESISRRRLSMVASPTVARGVFVNDVNISPSGPAEMRLDLANGEYILFRRANSQGPIIGGRRLVPVEHHKPGGYITYFDYNDTSYYPFRVRDSLNREMLLTWADAPGSSVVQGYEQSKVVSSIQLPDTTRIDYSYDHAETAYTLPTPTWATTANLDVRAIVGGIMGPIGSTIVYRIEGRRDRLRSVTRKNAAGATLWQRQYDYQYIYNPNALTSIRDQNGATLATYSYTGNAELASSSLAGGVEPYSFQHFNVFNNNVRAEGQTVRRVTGPLGRIEDYHLYRKWSASSIEPAAITRIDAPATATTSADSRTFDYHSSSGINLLMTRSVDQLGRETNYSLDVANGRPNAISEAAGLPDARGTTIQWHPTWDLPTRIERGGLRVDTAYNADAKVTSQTLTDLTTHSVPYTTNGQTRTTTYDWGPNARLLSVNGPRSPDAQGRDDTSSFAYSAAGNLLTMTNGLGQVVTYTNHNANGLPGQMTDANGIITLFTYDSLSRVTSISLRQPGTGTAHATTLIEYDIEGRVTGITRPATAKLSMTYDLAGRLLSVSAPTGERITYTHDAMGNVTRQRVANAANATRSDITRTFDALGRMLSESMGVGRTANFAYDAVGNPTRITSPRNFATDQSFDGLSRLVSAVMPDTGQSANAFNQNDDLASHTDAIGVATTIVHNGFGEVIQEVSPDRGTSTTTYNSAGDMLSATDGRGQRVDYTYDILGRVLTRTPFGLTAQRVTYAYDSAGIAGSYGVGRLSSITDGSGNTKYKYDHRGNVLIQRQVITGSAALNTSYIYDLSDRITWVTYPSGRWVNYARDVQGRVRTITTRAAGATVTQTLLSAATYEPFGALSAATLGNTQRFAQVFDATGRRTARRYRLANNTTNLWSVSYAYDNDDNILGITDLVDASRNLSFHYDSASRLTRVDMAVGALRREDYGFDLGGNRLRVERRALPGDAAPAANDNYTLTPGTNRLASVTTAAGVRSLSHDARGNLIGEVRPDGAVVTTAYDGYARLTAYVRTNEAAQAEGALH